MDEPIRILRPEQKHGEADAQRRIDDNITNLALYKTLAQEINNSSGCVETAPLTLYGVRTKEYCIVPCPFSDVDPKVVRVIQYMRGQGWVADLYRLSESLENPIKYRQAILVCWDPNVIAACYAPRYYAPKGSDRIPCGLCSKQDTEGVAGCLGCATFRLWLAGNNCMKTIGDPCQKCTRGGSRKKGTTCTDCPAAVLYKNLYSSKGEQSAEEEQTTPSSTNTGAPATTVEQEPNQGQAE